MKKVMCAIIVVCLVIGSSLYYYMNHANANVVSDANAKKYSFKYFHKGKDGSGDCWYSDDYFNKSACEYDKALSSASCSLALSALGNMSGTDTDYQGQSKNVADLLTQIGFSDIEANEGFKVKPTTDSVGTILANKQVNTDKGNVTLIAIAMRGAGYKKEWASNVTVGTKGNHQGFTEGKD